MAKQYRTPYQIVGEVKAAIDELEKLVPGLEVDVDLTGGIEDGIALVRFDVAGPAGSPSVTKPFPVIRLPRDISFAIARVIGTANAEKYQSLLEAIRNYPVFDEVPSE